MAFKPTHLLPWLTLLIWFFTTVAADVCTFTSDFLIATRTTTKYCRYGCCRNTCCWISGWLIFWICFGVGVVIFIIIVSAICIIRRRRTRSIVYQNQAATPFVVTSSTTTQGGMIGTSGIDPSVMYNQNYQPYGPYAPPTSQAGFQSFPPQPQPYGNNAPPPVSGGDAAIPPSYDSVTKQGAGGVANPGYESK